MTTTRSSEASKHDIDVRHPDQPTRHRDACMCDTCSDLKIRRSAGVGPKPQPNFDEQWAQLFRIMQRVNRTTVAMEALGKTLQQQDANHDLPSSVHDAGGILLGTLEAHRLDLLRNFRDQAHVVATNEELALAFRIEEQVLKACRPEPSNEPEVGPTPEERCECGCGTGPGPEAPIVTGPPK